MRACETGTTRVRAAVQRSKVAAFLSADERAVSPSLLLRVLGRLALAALSGRTLVLPKSAHLEHMGRTQSQNCCYDEGQVYDLGAMRAVADVINASECSGFCDGCGTPPARNSRYFSSFGVRFRFSVIGCSTSSCSHPTLIQPSFNTLRCGTPSCSHPTLIQPSGEFSSLLGCEPIELPAWTTDSYVTHVLDTSLIRAQTRT